jgi:hypothetical protein
MKRMDFPHIRAAMPCRHHRFETEGLAAPGAK